MRASAPAPIRAPATEPDRQRKRLTPMHLPCGAVGGDAGEADRDDRAERERVRIALAVRGPQNEQGDHDDPAADPEQSGEHTACYPDHDEAGREP